MPIADPELLERARAAIRQSVRRVFARDDIAPLREGVLALLYRVGGGVSFAEVATIPNARGRHNLVASERNIVIWSGLSLDMTTALAELRTEGLIRYVETHPFVYIGDGVTLDLPIATSAGIERGGYQTLHWLPATVERGPKWNPPQAQADGGDHDREQ